MVIICWSLSCCLLFEKLHLGHFWKSKSTSIQMKYWHQYNSIVCVPEIDLLNLAAKVVQGPVVAVWLYCPAVGVCRRCTQSICNVFISLVSSFAYGKVSAVSAAVSGTVGVCAWTVVELSEQFVCIGTFSSRDTAQDYEESAEDHVSMPSSWWVPVYMEDQDNNHWEGQWIGRDGSTRGTHLFNTA